MVMNPLVKKNRKKSPTQIQESGNIQNLLCILALLSREMERNMFNLWAISNQLKNMLLKMDHFKVRGEHEKHI